MGAVSLEVRITQKPFASSASIIGTKKGTCGTLSKSIQILFWFHIRWNDERRGSIARYCRARAAAAVAAFSHIGSNPDLEHGTFERYNSLETHTSGPPRQSGTVFSKPDRGILRT